ncbi:MAG: uncharacterized protein K0S91_1391 [Nitrososphaeraceae archaeon]|jgi:hypothetical protein|nr:uncharacterized protein [Nitrososphaeraceae archaeon]
MRLTIIMVAAVISLAAAIITILIISIMPTKDYSIEVDAMKDEQSLFVNARIVLTNTGRQPLTDVVVYYGNRNEVIKMINPGEKIYLSPPEGSRLDVVEVTTNEGVNMTKEYRKPIKLPGMMGS